MQNIEERKELASRKKKKATHYTDCYVKTL